MCDDFLVDNSKLTCENYVGWKDWLNRNIDCSWFQKDIDRCVDFGTYYFDLSLNFATDACCVCGGGTITDNYEKPSAFICDPDDQDDNGFFGFGGTSGSLGKPSSLLSIIIVPLALISFDLIY